MVILLLFIREAAWSFRYPSISYKSRYSEVIKAPIRRSPFPSVPASGTARVQPLAVKAMKITDNSNKLFNKMLVLPSLQKSFYKMCVTIYGKFSPDESTAMGP